MDEKRAPLPLPERPDEPRRYGLAQVGGAVLSLLVAGAALLLWMFEQILRGSTCGPAEGGGSCAAGATYYVLLVAAVAGLGLGVFLLARPRRRPRP
jgi:hypothetical protein